MNIVLKEIASDLDAFDIFTIFKEEENVALLDSGMDFESLGNYSFIGVNPFAVLKGNQDSCVVNDIEYPIGIFQKLMELLGNYSIMNNTGIPFTGGCIGYFSYDLGVELEQIRQNSQSDWMLPQCCFVFYDNLIIFNNKDGKKHISACGILEAPNQSISKIEEKISKQKKIYYPELNPSKAVFTSNFPKQDYMQAVGKMKEYIINGDIYIANMTQRFTAETKKDSYSIYRDLRKINPAPFAAFMKTGDCDIISSSPERFLKITGRQVETRPIKGTRPRGKDSFEDEQNRTELLQSEKDRAELLMIVDLERNDLSKVCKPHSVKVTELFKIEDYSTVFHLVSTVTGELKEGVSPVQCLKECFPGGSITGTPKIRAMEIIDELEGLKRSLYTGCLGYFSFCGNADFNIIIRTMIKKDNKVCFGVGGGITYDSVEEAEYQETLDKAKALMRVIE